MSQTPFRIWRQVRTSSALRLALLLSCLFSGTGLLAGMASGSILGNELEQRLVEDAQALANGLEANLQKSGPEALSRYIQALSEINDSHETLYFFAPTGGTSVGDIAWIRPFSGVRILTPGQDFGMAETANGVAEPETDSERGSDDEETYLVLGVQTPQGMIVVARDRQRVVRSQQVVVQFLAWGLGAAFLLTMIPAFAMARRDARRVAQLNQVLAAVASGDFKARYREEKPVADDLGQVGAGLNQMFERLEANVERLAQVSADIAHDLRSPLTRLRLRLEPQALRTDLPEETQQAIVASLDSLRQMAVSFEAILQLSQMETGALVLETTPVDLCEVGHDIHEMLSPVAEEMGHGLRFSSPPVPVWVDGDAGLLAQGLVNLVNNALLHTTPPAQVEIHITQHEEAVQLAVRDNGPGIPEAEREKVLQRFYRLDQSRYRPGAGLGLSLVQAIVNLHGGHLTLTDNHPGLCVILHLRTRTSSV